MSWHEPPDAPSPGPHDASALSVLVWEGVREHLLGLRLVEEDDRDAATGSDVAATGCSFLSSTCGLFVTLRLAGALRGCMGVLETSEPLATSVRRLARIAAGADPRFAPLRAPELTSLSAELTLLGQPVEPGCRGEALAARLRPGVHGARLRAGSRTGLLLPRVALDWGWSSEEFLARVAEKAGLDAAAWRDDATEVFVFRAVSLEVERP